MDVQDLPAVNATLNLTAAVCLLFGYTWIRQGRIHAHKRAMLSAFGCSMAFLVSYLVYHFQVGSVRFQGTGTVRTFYLTLLATHTVLAATVPFLASVTLYRALRDQISRHRKLARVTLPIWLYVSVTGVVIYWMLYRVSW